MKKLFVLLLFFSSQAIAQSQIIGTVVDAKTNEKLQFANVYISNTTKGTQTDTSGQFVLNNVTVGKIQLAASYVGYEGFQQTISVADGKQITLIIRMMPSSNMLSEVEIKAKKKDKNWERDLRTFKQQFLGTSANAGQCKILNEWAIELEESELDKSIRAKTSRPIEVENRALGYKIFYDLKQFSLTKSQFRLSGATRFENLKPADAKEAARWEENRRQTYELSERFFFKCLLEGTLEKNNFNVYRMRSKADWMGSNKDYRNASNFIADESRGKILAEGGANMLLFLELPIEVSNSRKYVNFNGQSQNPVTYIRNLKTRVELSQDGWLQDPTSIEMVGYWGTERVAEMLPREYGEKQDFGAIANAVPMVYLHLNKNGFVAGEKVWFSAYMLDRNAKALVQGQQPIYVQIYSPEGKKIAEEKIFTSNGRGYGNLLLDKGFFSGVYRLRAFTKSMLNAPESIFEKEIIIQNIQEKVQVVRKEHKLTNETSNALSISILPNEGKVNAREKITLKIKTQTPDNKPVQGVFSLSVTDEKRGVSTTDDFTILSYVAQNKKPKITGDVFKTENTMYLSGVVQREKSKKIIPEAQVILMLVDSTKKNTSRIIKADQNGFFEVTDLELSGNCNLVYQVNNKRGRAEYDGVIVFDELNPDEALSPISFDKTPMPDEKRTELFLSIQKLDGEEFVVPVGDILLDELVVKDQKADKDINEVGVIKLYSEPTHSVSFAENAPRFANIYDMLAGTLPGIQVSTDANGANIVTIRGVATLNRNEPLWVLDGTTISDPSIINPNDVYKIDLLSDGMAGGSYGIQASGGVILVYTRRFRSKYNNLVYAKSILMKGLQEDYPFYSPNYGQPKPDHKDPDRRTTIYWNPEIITDQNGEATVSFYAADNPTTYKIVVEGMTQGAVGRGEQKIEVK